MNFHSARRSWAGWLLAVAAGFLVAACGGGGGSSTTNAPNQGGLPVAQPDKATFYAGIPYTIVITGGKRPYTVTSTEPSLLPVPQTVDGGSFQVVAANPGVVDLNLPPDALPVRTVTIQVRDAQNQLAAPIQISVGQNFLTGYGFSLTSNCAATTGGNRASACSGGETAVRLAPITNGNLYGNRAVRFEVLKGPFCFEFPQTTDTNCAKTTTTDHTGVATAIFRVNANVPTQLAVLRVVDVATGVYADDVFVINGAGSGSVSTLTAIPSAFTFTGRLNTECGTGRGDFLVFDGVPPYTAVSSSTNLIVQPSSTGSNPGQFTIIAPNDSVCLDNATVIVTDATGARATVTVTTKLGTTAPPTPEPPPAITVAPTKITLGCGMSGQVTVVGGAGGYTLASTHPRVQGVVVGNTISITRLSADPAASTFPTTATISVTDGISIATVEATVPAFCP